MNSEIRRDVGRIIRWLSLGLLPIGAIVVNGQMQAAGGWSTAISTGVWRDAAVTSAASIIAMVPAGLVFMTSVALAVGAVRLARHRVLVGELAAVEGLARVDALCIDKTGTLTQGVMTVDRVEPVEIPAAGWQNPLAWLAADPGANATAQAIGIKFREVDADSPDAIVSFSSRHKWSAVHFSGNTSPGSWVLGGADVILTKSDGGRATRFHAARLAEGGEREPWCSPTPTSRFRTAIPVARNCPTVCSRRLWSSSGNWCAAMPQRQFVSSTSKASICSSSPVMRHALLPQ